MTTSHLIDVSTYQGAQDWPKLKASGIAGAFVKASEGMHGRDDAFAAHIKGVKAAGMIPGAYHFAWPNQDVHAEAANYISAVKPHAGKGFTHWLDLERYSDGRNYRGRTDAQIKAWAAEWVALVRAAFPGQRVGVYTSADDLARGHYPGNSDALWFPSYAWGHEAVSYAQAEAHARPKPSGHTVLAWQFTSTPVDRSLCYMSAAELRKWAGFDSAPAAPAVSLSKLVDAARHNPRAKGQPVTYSGVKIVERALVAEHLLDASLADGHFGTSTVRAYAAWQRRCGYSGDAADGIPGVTTLRKLAAKHGFKVAA